MADSGSVTLLGRRPLRYLVTQTGGQICISGGLQGACPLLLAAGAARALARVEGAWGGPGPPHQGRPPADPSVAKRSDPGPSGAPTHPRTGPDVDGGRRQAALVLPVNIWSTSGPVPDPVRHTLLIFQMDRWNRLPEEQQFAYGVAAQGLGLLGTIGTLYSQTGGKYQDSFNDNRNYIRHGGMDIDNLGKRGRPDTLLQEAGRKYFRVQPELERPAQALQVRPDPIVTRIHDAHVPRWEALEDSLVQDQFLDAIISDRPQITRARLVPAAKRRRSWYKPATGYQRFGRRKSRRTRFRRRRGFRPRRRFSRRRR